MGYGCRRSSGLGFGNIIPILGVPPASDPVVHGRLRPLGPGKELSDRAWELMGVVPAYALPTYPERVPGGRDRGVGGRPACLATAATGRIAVPR